MTKDNNSIDKELGHRLQVLRAELKLSQTQLAAVLNSHRYQIYKYESGRSKIPLGTIVKICKQYNVDLNYFMVDNEIPSTYQGISDQEMIRRVSKDE